MLDTHHLRGSGFVLALPPGTSTPLPIGYIARDTRLLRHSCSVMMLQATRDIRKVALWLGHADVRTTEIYLGLDPSEKLEAVEAVLPPNLASWAVQGS